MAQADAHPALPPASPMPYKHANKEWTQQRRNGGQSRWEFAVGLVAVDRIALVQQLKTKPLSPQLQGPSLKTQPTPAPSYQHNSMHVISMFLERREKAETGAPTHSDRGENIGRK